MRRVFLLRAYGDFVIAIQALGASDTIVASLHLKPLYEALISRSCIEPKPNLTFVDFGISGSQLNFFTNKKLFSFETIQQVSKIAKYIRENPGYDDYLEQSARLSLLSTLTGHSFKFLVKTGDLVYEAYGLAPHVPAEKGDQLLILPDARLKKREIPAEVISKIRGKVARFGVDYASFGELIDCILYADFLYAAVSLPVHLAYLLKKPHALLYPVGGKLDFFTPDVLEQRTYYTFTEFKHV